MRPACCTVLQFQREVVAMTLLPDHPNVLRLLGACMRPPLMALVTPFCPKCAQPFGPLPTTKTGYLGCALLPQVRT